MEARIAIAVAAATILIGDLNGTASGQQRQQMFQAVTENFVVTAPGPQLARRAATMAEEYRSTLSKEWLGYEIETWQERCPITIEIGPHAGGETSFGFVSGSRDSSVRAVPMDWRMKIFGPPDRVLDAVLPHEITHTIFATHFGRPLPRWADEGACTTVEHESERAKNHQLLMQFLTAKPSRGIPFNRMFTMKQYPHDILPLYAQGHSLAKFLIQRKGKRYFVDYIDAGLDQERKQHPVTAWDHVTQEFYQFDNLSELQIAWQGWVQKGCPPQERVDSAIAAVGYEAPEAPADQTARANPTTSAAPANFTVAQNARPESWYVRQAVQPPHPRTTSVARNPNAKVAFNAKDDSLDHDLRLRDDRTVSPYSPGSVTVPQFRPPNIPARRSATMSSKDSGTLWR